MKLYYFETLNPRKACAVAKYLGSPVEFVRVDLGKGEQKAPGYLAINPNGKVPALTDGEAKIWEANAIMAYLARLTHADLWPRDERQIEVTRLVERRPLHAPRGSAVLPAHHQAALPRGRAGHQGSRRSDWLLQAVRAGIE